MIRRVIFPIILAACFCPPCPAQSAEPAPSADFVESVRTLLLLQDQAAEGHADAPRLQKDIIQQIGLQFQDGRQLPPADERSLRAALSFTLSGGPPGIAEGLAKIDGISPQMKRLLEAAAHFKRGEKDEAAKLLVHVDATKLAEGIGGRVALLQAMLVPDTDAKKKLDLLEIASSLMPGTLVEEAALRRETLFAAAIPNSKTFWKTAGRYFRRFGASLYAPSFFASVVQQMVGLEAKAGKPDRDQTQDLMNLVPLAQRRSGYLAMARLATREGLPALAQFAANRARRLAVEGSCEWQQAELYDAVHGITGTDFPAHLLKLKRIDPGLLESADRELLAIALKVAETIRSNGGGNPGSPRLAAAGMVLPADQAALQARADQALKNADTLLDGLKNNASQN